MLGGDLLENAEQVKNWIINAKNDPIVSLLIENGLITKIQMETLLIENLSNQLSEKKVSTKRKSKMRISNKNVSRGSYSRTLSQARKNVRKAVFTLILLGYVGLHETPELLPFISISNKIRSLVDLHTEYQPGQSYENNGIIVEEIGNMRREIEESLLKMVRSRRVNKSRDL